MLVEELYDRHTQQIQNKMYKLRITTKSLIHPQRTNDDDDEDWNGMCVYHVVGVECVRDETQSKAKQSKALLIKRTLSLGE